MIPLVTAFIAAVVAFIAFLQWKTAQEKVLLDLFDKRFAVYDELRSVVGRHLSGGIDDTALFGFKRTASRAQFLFGSEVRTFLEERWIDLKRDMDLRNNPQPQPVPEHQRAAAISERVARKDRLSDFFKDFDQLVAPYMNHHQNALSQSWAGLARSVVGRVRD